MFLFMIDIASEASYHFDLKVKNSSGGSLSDVAVVKDRAKPSAHDLCVIENERFVLWTSDTADIFEKGFLEDTPGGIDTGLKKSKHSSSIWGSNARNAKLGAEGYEIVNTNQERFHVVCKDCGYAAIHSTSGNIDTNTMTRHRETSIKKCITKVKKKSIKQMSLTKSFASVNYFLSHVFIINLIILF